MVDIASDNGFSPIQRYTIIWTNKDLLSFKSLITNLSEKNIYIPARK